MLLTVGIGAVLMVVVDDVDDVVAGQTLSVVLLVVMVCPPTGGFLETQSFLVHLPAGQMLPQ